MSLVLLVFTAAAALDQCRLLDLSGSAEAPACFRAVAGQSGDPLARAEALRGLGDVAAANAAYRNAAELRPDDAQIRARWGLLYLDVHQDADAQALFLEALERDPDDPDALLGLAELALGRFDAAVHEYLERAERHPEAAPRVRLLEARLALERGDTAAGRAILQAIVAGRDDAPGAADPARVRALAVQLDGYALLAAADALDAVSPSPWLERALARNPRFGAAHSVPAHYFVINRRYREAVARYEQAVTIEPDAWNAHAQLGINLMRVNRPGQARAHLERAYQGDPYNALTVNSLRLLDLLDQFAEVRSQAVLLRAPADQAPLLMTTVDQLAGRARDEMSARYGYVPDGEVLIEIYQHHDDFAVRTVGLPGIGILGATFGDVVVMDGPAAKSIDEGFDWVSALWHELAHVYTLGATDNRVSRWLSEGISVMEEWRFGPTRREAVPLHFLEALADDRLLGVTELDDGFMRPSHPQQVATSYVQSGLLCGFIADQHPGGLARMLSAYREGAGTSEAVRRGLGVAPAELDRNFRAYLNARFGELAAGLDDYRQDLQSAHEAVGEENWPAARAAAARAVARYPSFVDAGSAYLPLARAQSALDQPADLLLTVEDYFRRGGRDPWALAQLAGATADAGLGLQALATLARTTPLDGAVRLQLGDALAAQGQAAAALAEYRAALQLDPLDVAPVYYRLARSHYQLGNLDDARNEVLRALEIAPGYGPALDLLLTLAAAEGPDGRANDGG